MKLKFTIILLITSVFQGLYSQIERVPANAREVHVWDLKKTGQGSSSKILSVFKNLLDSTADYYPQKLMYEYFVKSKGAGVDFSGKIIKYKFTDSYTNNLVMFPLADRKACITAMNKIAADFVIKSYYESESYKILHKQKGKREFYFYYRNMEVTPEECIVIDEKQMFLIRKYKSYNYDEDYVSVDSYGDGADYVAADTAVAYAIAKDPSAEKGGLYSPNSEYDKLTNFKLKYWKEHAPQPRYVAVGVNTLYDKLEKDTVFCLDTSEVGYWEAERVPEAELYKLADYTAAYNKYTAESKRAEQEAEKKRLEAEKRKEAEKEKIAELKWAPYFEVPLAPPAENIIKSNDFAVRYAEGSELLNYVNNNNTLMEMTGHFSRNKLLSSSSFKYQKSRDSLYKSLPFYKLVGDHKMIMSLDNAGNELTCKIVPGFAPDLIRKAFVPQNEEVVKQAMTLINPEHRYNVSLTHLNLSQILNVYEQLGDSFYKTLDILVKQSEARRNSRFFEFRMLMTSLDMVFRNMASSDFMRSMEGTVVSTTTGHNNYTYKYSSYVYTEEGDYKDTMLERTMQVPTQLIVIPLNNKEDFLKGILPLIRYGWLQQVQKDLYRFGIGDYERVFNLDNMYNAYLRFNGNNLLITNDSNYVWGNAQKYNNTIPEGLDLKSPFTGIADGLKTREIIYSIMGMDSPRKMKKIDDVFGGLKSMHMNVVNGETIIVKGLFEGKYPVRFYEEMFRQFIVTY